MGLGHVRAHDQDAVRVLQVLLVISGAAAPERGAQTGHRRAVSYARLVLDLDRAERREQLLDQVVLFGVERGAPEERDPARAVERIALLVLGLPALLARLDHAVDNHVGGLFEVELGPRRAIRRAVLDLVRATRAVHKLLGCRALRTEAPARDRAGRVALDLDDLLVLHVDLLAATDGAVRADRLDDAIGGLRASDELLRVSRLGGLPEREPIAARELLQQCRLPLLSRHPPGSYPSPATGIRHLADADLRRRRAATCRPHSSRKLLDICTSSATLLPWKIQPGLRR